MKLYTAKLAPNPRRVHMFLAEKGLWETVERVELDLATQTKVPIHLERNPTGLVPVLELDDGRFLTESRAICSYLEHLHPEPNLMGETPEERAFIEMFDRRVEWSVLLPLMNWVRHAHPALGKLENPQIPDFAEACSEKAKAALVWLDADLAERDFVAGNRFTVADITAFSGLEFARLVKFKPWEIHPNIARWRDAVKARPSADASLA
ncbi:MAG: glutathione S-transferase [Alphaproteobacteria bacterium PA3]|nr:MAG: glutathione S-transferase [Alphaproteobacteria bacterium PA3]